MVLALFGPLREVLRAGSNELATRAKASVAKVTLAFLAAGFLLSAVVSLLVEAVGYPLAALIFGMIFACLALAVHLKQRSLAARRAQRVAHATQQVRAELVVGITSLRSAVPLLPILALIAAFAFGRRR